MINQELLPSAYAEVLEILNFVSEEYLSNIPEEIIDFFHKESKKDYQYTVTEFDSFENQEMLYETRVILSVLYRDYFASDEERKEILQEDNLQMQIIEEEKRKKYNVDNIFNNVKKENITENNESNVPVQIKKKKFITILIDKIKNIFK